MLRKLLIAFSAVLVFWTCSYAQDSPLRIIERPKPALPKDYGTLDAQGSIILRVQFLATGKIGTVAIVKGMNSTLNDVAVEAAKAMRFEPRVENGKKIDSFKQFEYIYSWDGGWQGVWTPVSMPLSQETHEAWLLKRMDEVRTIRPGMTRVDLLKIFQEDGGFNGVPANRYILKSCPYIKVEVEFDIPNGRYKRDIPDSQLKITKISTAYLGYMVLD